MENREGLKLIFCLSHDHIYSETEYDNLTLETLLEQAALHHRLSIMLQRLGTTPYLRWQQRQKLPLSIINCGTSLYQIKKTLSKN